MAYSESLCKRSDSLVLATIPSSSALWARSHSRRWLRGSKERCNAKANTVMGAVAGGTVVPRGNALLLLLRQQRQICSRVSALRSAGTSVSLREDICDSNTAVSSLTESSSSFSSQTASDSSSTSVLPTTPLYREVATTVSTLRQNLSRSLESVLC